jgi:tol-pal system protein YbgF
MRIPTSQWVKRAVLPAFLGYLLAFPAFGALFEDDEARREILKLRTEMRQGIETLRRDESLRREAAVEDAKRQAEEIAYLSRLVAQLKTQLESIGGEAVKIRGQGEQLGLNIAEVQRRHAEQIKRLEDQVKRLEDRLKIIEPVKVSFEGSEFFVEPAEKSVFEAALASFRRGDFETAQNTFNDFLTRFPGSGYSNSALFWLGNAQFVLKNYPAAVTSFRKMIARSPGYARVPEAWLAIANCQLELKEMPQARKTLEDLVANFSQSEAADIARDRLSRMK